MFKLICLKMNNWLEILGNCSGKGAATIEKRTQPAIGSVRLRRRNAIDARSASAAAGSSTSREWQHPSNCGDASDVTGAQRPPTVDARTVDDAAAGGVGHRQRPYARIAQTSDFRAGRWRW